MEFNFKLFQLNNFLNVCFLIAELFSRLNQNLER